MPTAIIGASPAAAGTARAQLALRSAFVFTQTPVLPGPEVLVGRAPSVFDEDGRLTSSKTQEFLRAFVERFEEFARQLLREPAY